MDQEVRVLKLEDLVLWTENPRDSIDEIATDQDIVNRALEDERSKWSLPKLAKEMGSYYDYSELPTVVFHGDTPVVYDGNRRIILGKIQHGFVYVDGFDTALIPSFPPEIPCNICSKEIALQNVYRKHANTGSWLPLERDIFLHKHMKQEKTPFLIMEESTGIISANPHLNKRFVKEEIFTYDILNKLGISFTAEKMSSKHSTTETKAILEDISKKIKDKEISTRKNRGQVLEVLDPPLQQIVEEHKRNKLREVNVKGEDVAVHITRHQQSKRLPKKAPEIFGGKLYLRHGNVSDLYRDIYDLYGFYRDKQHSLSDIFPNVIRMALRLLCEVAAQDCEQKLETFIKARFKKAKETMDQDAKTTLSTNNVTEGSIMQLLHTGAHHYTSSTNIHQTLAISVIIGAILTDSHGKAVST